MSEAFGQFWWWVVTPPHFLWRVPAVILAALLAWGLWWWLWDVLAPWAKLALRVLGKVFDRLGDLLEFIPRKSKEAAWYVEHVMRICDGKYSCKYCKAAAERQAAGRPL